MAAAERAKDDADNELSDRQTDLAVARLRRDEMRQRLEEAERNLSAADKAYGEAKQASREAAEMVKEAKARLKQIQAHEIAQPMAAFASARLSAPSTRRVFVAR